MKQKTLKYLCSFSMADVRLLTVCGQTLLVNHWQVIVDALIYMWRKKSQIGSSLAHLFEEAVKTGKRK